MGWTGFCFHDSGDRSHVKRAPVVHATLLNGNIDHGRKTWTQPTTDSKVLSLVNTTCTIPMVRVRAERRKRRRQQLRRHQQQQRQLPATAAAAAATTTTTTTTTPALYSFVLLHAGSSTRMTATAHEAAISSSPKTCLMQINNFS